MSVMHRAYVTLFLDFYFFFDMFVIVSTNTHSTNVFPSRIIQKSSKQPLMLPLLHSSSANQSLENRLGKQNTHGVTLLSIFSDIPNRISSNRRRLTLKTSTFSGESHGKQNSIHGVVVQKARHNDIHKISAAETEVWRRSKFIQKSDLGESSHVNDHKLVKRDSSLLTEYCGPLGDRCKYVGVGACVNICINGHRKRLCKVRNTQNNFVCVVL